MSIRTAIGILPPAATLSIEITTSSHGTSRIITTMEFGILEKACSLP